VRRWIEETLGVVLAVHRGHERGDRLQDGERNERAIDGRLSLARGVNLAADDDLVALRGQAVFLQEFLERGAVGQRLDDGALFARPDEVGRGPLAQDEPECVYQDGLAGAGFPRQERQARAELDLQGGNERDIVDSEQLDHTPDLAPRRYDRPSEAVNAR
jgi:hypothetical protein